MKAKPFVKWVGGKSQLLVEIRKKYPQKIEKYCEPFVGGGAVLFDILQKFQPNEVLINDINKELINTYFQVKNHCEGMIKQLDGLQTQYKKLGQEDRKVLFYEKRTRYNELKVNGDDAENLEKATLFIFLNKTCFNGLYRVNSKGLFNVPFNNAKNPLICDAENLRSCSQVLQNVILKTGDYKECESFIDERTFVYIDPPYRPLTQTSAFTSYSENQFLDAEQIELAQFIDNISKKGSIILASNSDPKNSNEEDNFFDNLYSNFEIERVSASRMINANGTKRGKLSELLIYNQFVKQEFKYTAEELFNSSDYFGLFVEEFGNPLNDKTAKSKYEKDISKTKNYKPGFFYHAVGGVSEIGLGKGLYLGKDASALFNFYNGEGEFGDVLIEYYGFPNFVDLSSTNDYENFVKEAIQLFGKDAQNSYLCKLTLQKGFDGIRYFDPYTTGEEFVLFNTDVVKQISKIKY